MDSLQPGQMLGPYRLIEQIGQGGMATVFKAYQPAMDRYVALKILPRQLADSPTFLGRFQQEARIIANLEHPHILPVHDYGESEGITYLVMRYLDTGTLKERMSGHPLSLQEIDSFFSQLADALEYAHARGVIHRDLKPSNVLVDARGNLFLTDFGIAKLLESSPQFTGTGGMIGTPDYMSPEQAQAAKVDQRSDIYSLGIILYEMVTGQVPFCADTPLAVILKHLHEPLPLPSTLKPGLSPAIERVLLKALAKSPDDRFATVDAFHEAWKRALAETGTMRPSPAVSQATQIAPAGTATITAQAAAAAPSTAASTPAAPAKRAVTPSSAAGQARPATRKWPIAGLVAGGALIVLICGGLAAAGFVGALNLGLWPGAPTRTLAPGATPAPTSAVAPSPRSAVSPTPGAAVPTPAPRATGQWTSWVGANHLWSIALYQDEVIAGGQGLTLWNRKTGALIRQIIGPPDGLPNVFVNAILVGDGGALWIATPDGVGFYDGQHWTPYDTADGLDSDTVGALEWGPDGLLAGTQFCGVDGCGLNLLTNDGFKPVKGFLSVAEDRPGTPSSNVTALLTIPPDRKVWWVGTMRGLARYEEPAKKWTFYFQADGLPDDYVNTLMLDGEGTVWVGTKRGAAKFDGTGFEPMERLQDQDVLGMVQDAQGRYWFSGAGGLARLDPKIGDWKFFTASADGLPSYNYYAAQRDADGALYFGSDSGVVRSDGEKFSTWAVANVPALGAYGKILPAPEGGALWFVKQYGGSHPDRLDLSAQTWSTVRGLPDACNPLAVAADKAVWCGGSEGLWIVSAGGSQAHFTTAEGLPSDTVAAVAFPAAPKGSAWVGTEDKGVAVFDGKKITQVFDVASGALSGDSIHALLAASDGSMWVGSDKGVDRLLPGGQWEHYTVGHPPFGESSDFYVADIAEGANGAIWVSTSGECSCVHRFAGGQWELFSADDPGVNLPHEAIQDLTTTPDGAVWFGTYYGGAARFDGKTWTLFTPKDGLIDSNITDIYVDQSGAVWFASDGGVTRYVP